MTATDDDRARRRSTPAPGGRSGRGAPPTGPLHVPLGRRSYDVQLATAWRGLRPALRAVCDARRALLVSDDLVAPLHADPVRRELERSGLRVATMQLPVGEAQKTLKTASRIYERAVDHELDRGDLVVALGGGVVGDLAGFAAATYLRGIACVQLPTSLLAMVDAAIGGKTGANLSRGKNLVGAFHQPRLVYVNLATLETLPARQLRAGMAEVIKSAVIRDAALFRFLEQRLDAVMALEPRALATAVHGAARVKARIVARDERETGCRALLNYGHTIGHAIEVVTRYRRYLHGEAVALGMIAAAELAGSLALCGARTVERQRCLIAAAGLPVEARGIVEREIFQALRRDKKRQAGRLRFVLTSKVGSASVHSQPSAKSIRYAIASITQS